VDASLAVKVVVTEPGSDKADALFDQWSNEGIQLIAPAFFAVETDSILRQKVILRKELTPEQVETAFAKLQTLPIQQWLENFVPRTPSSQSIEEASHGID
jgi:predicted nucleic acid-binding protein